MDESSPSYRRKISPGRFCFRMTDIWGDGICCGRQGNGSFNVTVSGRRNRNGTVVASGGNFRFSSGDRCFRVDRFGRTRRTRPSPTALCGGPDRKRFYMCIDLVDPRGLLQSKGLSDELQTALVEAKQQWESIVIQSDSIRHRTRDGLNVDNIFIEVIIREIDGPRGTVAIATPGEIERDNSSMPLKPFTGIVAIDEDDLETVSKLGNLHQVLMHEIGHILGNDILDNTLHQKESPTHLTHLEYFCVDYFVYSSAPFLKL